jgi:hypothetical protein
MGGVCIHSALNVPLQVSEIKLSRVQRKYRIKLSRQKETRNVCLVA